MSKNSTFIGLVLLAINGRKIRIDIDFEALLSSNKFLDLNINLYRYTTIKKAPLQN